MKCADCGQQKRMSELKARRNGMVHTGLGMAQIPAYDMLCSPCQRKMPIDKPVPRHLTREPGCDDDLGCHEDAALRTS